MDIPNQRTFSVYSILKGICGTIWFRGRPLMIWVGAPEEIEKKNFSRPFSGEKNFLEATLRGKKFQAAPSREKKKKFGCTSVGKKKFLGKPPRRKKIFWEASLKKNIFLGSSSGEKKFIVEKFLRAPQIINGRPLIASFNPLYRTMMVILF